MRHDHSLPTGSVQRLWCDSALLGDNMLGDPSRRAIDVYTPAGHDGAGLPLLVDLAGFTGSGLSHTNWKNFGENLPRRLDRLVHNDLMPPAVVAFPDCFTRLGGNQYINSTAMGPWEDYLLQEAVPLVEEQFSCGGEGRRGVFGKSSGGYGAIVHAMRHGGSFWAAAACHSGDMGFELLFTGDFPKTLQAIDKRGSIKDFIEAFESENNPSSDDIHALMVLAMAATYDPDPDAFLGIRLPVTLDTCEFIEDRWAKHLAWDPLVMVDDHIDNLKAMKALFIDCGTRDQFNLLYGARRLSRRLDALGVDHEYQEFEDNHFSIDYRMDESLPFLASRLSGETAG